MNSVRSILKLFPLVMFMACSSNDSSGKTDVSAKPKLIKLHIKNNSFMSLGYYWPLELTITNSNKLNKIQSEIEELEPFSDSIVVNYHVGLISLECYYNDDSEVEYDLIYSIYYGVVITEIKNHFVSDTFYKNDELEMLVTKYLSDAYEEKSAKIAN